MIILFLMIGEEKMGSMLIAGGAGFIGSNFIRYIINTYPDEEIINLDKLTYAGNKESLSDISSNKRYKFIKGDIADASIVKKIFSANKIDLIINFAAESHVDRSITKPDDFVKTNILGAQVLLHAAMEHAVSLFIQISTDEVYGSLGPAGYFTEDTLLKPNSPYSASKAGADLIVRSYFKTYSYPAIITRCSNNYGPYQFPEKLIPLFITNALADQGVPIYGDGLNVRDWIHVEDHCAAIDMVRKKGRPGEVYNIGGSNEKTNIEITGIILDILDKPQSLKRFVKDRPGHDRRYAIDSTKIEKELGWRPKVEFSEGIRKTVEWYKNHHEWWEKLKRKGV